MKNIKNWSKLNFTNKKFFFNINLREFSLLENMRKKMKKHNYDGYILINTDAHKVSIIIYNIE